MDEYGIYAQVLYPNLIGFESPLFMRLGPEVSLACTQAYNDFIREFARPTRPAHPDHHGAVLGPGRRRASRCSGARRWATGGSSSPTSTSMIGLPAVLRPALGPHLRGRPGPRICRSTSTSGSRRQHGRGGQGDDGAALQLQREGGGQGDGARDAEQRRLDRHHRHERAVRPVPALKFVSVESGFGYITYLLDSLDWHWRGYGAHLDSELLPSEYFQRQCYGSFWFETRRCRCSRPIPTTSCSRRTTRTRRACHRARRRPPTSRGTTSRQHLEPCSQSYDARSLARRHGRAVYHLDEV